MTALTAPDERDMNANGASTTIVGAENRHQGAVHPELISRHKYKFRSKFLLACAIFAVINGLLTFFTPIQFDSYKFVYKGWSWWIFNDLRTCGRVNNIAILGSSTMVSALAGTDANLLQSSLDLSNHHRSVYLENSLKSVYKNAEFQSFSLAAPGQMPSDAYITLKGMIASAHRPDVVIYGVAPRDFIDSTLTAPGDTDAFKYLTRIVNIDDVAQRVFRSFWSKLDWLFQRNIYMYFHSIDLRVRWAEMAESFINKTLPRPWAKFPFTWWHRREILPEYLPADMYPRAVMTGPLVKGSPECKYADNTLEYKMRYKHPDKKTYKTQMFFLAKIAELCRKERMELVIVNMPICRENIALLKPGGYLGYLQGLREFGLAHGVSVYDLNDFSAFSKEEFHDSVHLNAFGGAKFLDSLSYAIKMDPRLSVIVSMSGEHLAKHKKLAAKPVVPTF